MAKFSSSSSGQLLALFDLVLDDLGHLLDLILGVLV